MVKKKKNANMAVYFRKCKQFLISKIYKFFTNAQVCKTQTWLRKEQVRVLLFQSKSAPVHCCPASCKWTSKPTLNKKSQDCSVIQCPVKTRLPDILETAGFSAKVYLYALSQHCASNFLVQCCLRHIWTTLTRQYSLAMLFQHGQHNTV